VEAGVLPADLSDVSLEAPGGEHVLDSRRAGRRFLRGSSMRLVAFAAGLAAGLGSTPLVVHHLGPTAWGEYGAVAALMFIVAAITEGGLGQMGVRELSIGEPADHRRFMAELLGLRIALTLAGALLALAFSLAAGYTTTVVEGTAIAGAGMLLTNVAGTLALPLSAELRLGWMAVLDFLPQLVIALTMIALVLAGAHLLPFYTASVAAGTASVLVAAAAVRGQVSLPSFKPRGWRRLLAQTLIYAAATATASMYFRIVLVATSVLSSRPQTGYFSLAFRILELTAVVPWLLASSAFPILLRSAWNDHERLRYAIDRLLRGALILGGWFSLCLVIGAPFVIHVLSLGSGRFAPSVPVLRILAPAIPATFVLATLAFALLSLQLFRGLLIANGLIIGLAILLSWLLVPQLGAEGAALVSLTLELVLMCSYGYILGRSYPDLRPALAGFWRIAVSLGVSFAVGAILLAHPVLGALAGSATFACTLLALRAIPAELLEIVGR
jgi:O-antigen/teichoic acid export membrane protein